MTPFTRIRAWLLCVCATLTPTLAAAAQLSPGDLVIFSDWPCGIFRLDPRTLSSTQISDCLGFGAGYHHVTVDPMGRVLVTDPARGVVGVSPATGERTVFVTAEALGAPPRGIAAESDGDILVSVRTTPPRILRVAADTKAVTVVTEGGFLSGPTSIDVMPDGTILVADETTPTTTPIPDRSSMGALIRVNATTGEQVLVAAAPQFRLPQDLAFVGDDLVWIVNRSARLRSVGGEITVTRLSDGETSDAPIGFTESVGVALLSGGRIAHSGCMAIHGDCSQPYVSLMDNGHVSAPYMGRMAVVPELRLLNGSELQFAPASPNPFAASSTLRFHLPLAGATEVEIYAVDGRRVTTLHSGPLEAGVHDVTWLGTDANGRPARAGVYYARLRWHGERLTRTLVLVR